MLVVGEKTDAEMSKTKKEKRRITDMMFFSKYFIKTEHTTNN
jgi:hypothetical protein